MIQDVVGGRLEFAAISIASISRSDARVLAIRDPVTAKTVMGSSTEVIATSVAVRFS
jgi:hypothetical protein